MRIAIAADHAGVAMKRAIAEELKARGYDLLDLGTHAEDPVDYPDMARTLGDAINGGEAKKGIFICGSGIGASIAANKIKGIRAGVAHDIYGAHQGVEHDDMNVLCLGARVIGIAPALEIAAAFAGAVFSNEERHRRRVQKVLDIEARGR